MNRMIALAIVVIMASCWGNSIAVCPDNFPTIERHFEANHGDVCRNKKRHGFNVGWVCPVGCKESPSRSPYCSMSSSSNTPCRIKSGIKENEGVKNIGKDCLNKGECGNYGNMYSRGGQGPCNYCGPEGYCCRKEKSGWWDKTSGCDGTFGGERGHQCAARPGCTVAKVGSSDKISKTITIANGFYCPKVVDSALWLPNIDRLRTGIEQFKVDQSGTQVTVTRFDKYSLGKNAFKGWHRDLRFHCCKNEDTCSYSYKYKKLCGDDCTPAGGLEGNSLGMVNANEEMCKKHCDKTKGCQSFTYCRRDGKGEGLCYVYDQKMYFPIETTKRVDKCTSYYRTCKPIN